MQKIFKFLKSYSTLPEQVDRLIISSFMSINRLQPRSNKLLQQYYIQESDEDYDCLLEFSNIIISELPSFDIERLIEVFEFVISPSDRIITGAVYTPQEIREYIIKKTFKEKKKDLGTIKIADIACGCGGFLLTAAQELKKVTKQSYLSIYKNQLFGLDIQNYSIIRSKLLLSLLALFEGEDEEIFQFNLYQGDSLVFDWKKSIKDFAGFGIIAGNPPYVCARNLDDDVKANLKKWSVSQSGNPDLYIPFFQIGYENLAENGILGYITMNTFFKSLNGRILREYFKKNQAKTSIVDFGTNQMFKSRSTYTCICFIENVQQSYLKYYKSINKETPAKEIEFEKINYSVLDSKKGWNLNNNKIISKIEAVGVPFGELYQTRHGIATLRNDIYIFNPVREDEEFLYLQNGRLFPIEKSICKDIINSNKLSREIDFANVVEKVIFPYDSTAKPKALEEEILQQQFPRAYEYFTYKKHELSLRDKGEGSYEKWFAFGRTQSLAKVGNKLFFPKISDKIPNYLVSEDEDLLFYNGQAIIGHTQEEMQLIKKIMESRLFWYYIKSTSKPYSSEYYSLNGNYIRNFGIYDFSTSDIEYILNERSEDLFNEFLEDKYQVNIR